MFNFYIYKGKYVFSWMILPLLALSLIFINLNGPLSVPFFTILNLLLILIGISDLKTGKIPNAYTLSLIILGLFQSTVNGTIIINLLFSIIMFLLLVPVKGIGGGDIKFFIAGILILNIRNFIISFFILAALSLFLSIKKGVKSTIIRIGPPYSLSIWITILLTQNAII